MPQKRERMPKTKTLYIAEDSEGTVRISASKDASLASSHHYLTNCVTIYGSPTAQSWDGSCRMSQRARKRFRKTRLREICSRHVSLDGALTFFAQAIAELEEAEVTKAQPLSDADLCLSEWLDDYNRWQLAVEYRSLFAKVFSANLNPSRNTLTNMLAVYNRGSLIGVYPLAKGDQGATINQIVNIIDEVVDEKRTRTLTSRSRASTKANRRARR